MIKFTEIQSLIKQSHNGYRLFLEEFSGILRVAQFCESPVEAILFWEFVKKWESGATIIDDNSSDALNELVPCKIGEFKNKLDIMRILVQDDVKIKDKTYRCDFSILAYDPHENNGVSFYIEVDGHDFHEKTKAQVIKDKQRDRAFQKAGLQVMRFTGSEVYHNPSKVLDEIKEWLESYGKSTT